MKMIRSLLLALSCGAPALLGCGGGETVLGSSVGPQPVTLAAPAAVNAIAADATSVYWSTIYGDVMKVPIEGVQSQLIATVGGRALTVGATGVYCIGDAGATRIPLDGGTPTLLGLGNGQGVPTGGVAVNATDVYWTAQNAIMKLPLGGGSATPNSPRRSSCRRCSPWTRRASTGGMGTTARSRKCPSLEG